MNKDIESKVKSAVENKIIELQKEINDLFNYVLDDKDLYFKASWFDPFYPSTV